MKNHEEIKHELNKVGPGFCLAKWTQVTIHLQMGQTHSCHHPNTHAISLSETKRNPSALHNTKYKKEMRKQMLEGKRPKECDYCWNVEDTSDRFSDRVYKSQEPWSQPFLEEIKTSDWRNDYNPRYVEVAFSNVCNFKCSYCGPSFSSLWVQEAQKYGPYPTDDNFNDISWLEKTNRMPFKANEENPYLESFWKWWPDLYRDLHTFRMTGGEPLLSPDFWKILDYIINEENPNTKLKLGINSNLGVSDVLIDRLIEKIKIIEERNLVSELILYTSCDTAGTHAEYIRHGLNYDRWTGNIDKILTHCKKTSIVNMSTFNALSIPRYKELLAFIYDMKKKHNSPDRYWCPAIFIDSSYLRHPALNSVKILPIEWKEKVIEAADFAESLRTIKDWEGDEWFPWYMGFTDIEIDKLRRIADWMADEDPDGVKDRHRRNFYNFFTEHDRRRGTDFKSTFPVFAEFYDNCGKIKQHE